MTEVHPAAIAGASDRINSVAGAFQTIIAATPIGSRVKSDC